jgi:ABC-type lipoprotein export system ATPase subunit
MAMSFEVKGLTYRYTKSGPDVLSQVELAIPAGKTTVVLGQSGSGKSTLLYVLGLLWDGGLQGNVVYRRGRAAFDYAKLSAAKAAELRRTDFGFILQSSYMLPHFTCAQNAAMPLSLLGRDRPEESDLLRQLIARVDDKHGKLASVTHHAAGDVSGGQRQRFAVVRSVIHDPLVVFADEPFSSLDEDHTVSTLDLLHDWREGRAFNQSPRAEPRTLILVCHDLQMAWDRGDYFVFVTRSGHVLGAPTGVVSRARFTGPADLLNVIRDETLPKSLPEPARDGVAAVSEVA